ncbi:MAG: phage holin family protein [Candidatus Eisenbacteria bacterium]|nr:phage holin family protein [Candidatus Eisenbacteria bacterium]
MRGFFTRLIVTFIALGLTTALLPGIEVEKSGAKGEFLALGAAALVLAALNAIARPVLIFFTLPLTIVTLGLFVLILNGLLLWLTSLIVHPFHISNFWWALLGTVVLSIISAVLNAFIRDR